MNCQTNLFLSVRNRAVLLSGGLRLCFCQFIPERLAGTALSQGEADVGVHTVDEVGGHQNAGGHQDDVVGGAQYIEEGFSIRDFYLSVAGQHPVYGVNVESFRMLDVGKPDALAQAADFLASCHSTCARE